jgi:hypothetical protein
MTVTKNAFALLDEYPPRKSLVPQHITEAKLNPSGTICAGEGIEHRE